MKIPVSVHIQVTRYLLIMLIVLGSVTFASETKVTDEYRASRVDELIAPWNKTDSPGVAVAVIHDGRVKYTAEAGSANLEYGISITQETIFQAASLSKQFTAFSLAVLAEQNKLSLDDDVRKYLPWVPDFGTPITIRHLIHHTSGLRDLWELLIFAGWRMDDVVTQDHARELVKRQNGLNFEPGREYRYTNTGYALLPEIVEQVTGQSFTSWTADNIFKPLGMNNTRFQKSYKEVIHNRAYSYFETEGGYEKAPANVGISGATNLFTTAEDLTKWVLNFDHGSVGGADLIKRIVTPGTLNDGKETNYGFGLHVGTYRGLEVMGHGGGQAGFRTYLLRFPTRKFGVVVLSNLGNISAGTLARQIATIFLHEEMSEESAVAVARSEENLDSREWGDFAGTYLLSPGYALTIRQHENKMLIRTTGQEEVPMRPETSNRFFVDAYGTTVSFKPDQDKRSVMLEFMGMYAKRVVPFVPSLEELEAFTGTYFSEELLTSYDFIIRDGGLVLKHKRRGSEPLYPTVMDQFSEDMADDFGINQPWFRSFDFERAANGSITGCRLSVAGAQDVWFEKTN